MEPIIKRAGPEDIDVLVALGRKTFYEAFGEFNTEENMRLFLEANFQPEVLEKEMDEVSAVFFLVWWGDAAIGFTKLRTGYEPEGVGPGALEVERIYVDKDYQDKKIGTLLMGYNITYGLKEGFTTIWLGVWEHNLSAIRFYTRWGFTVFGEHPFMLGHDRQTDVLMKRPL